MPTTAWAATTGTGIDGDPERVGARLNCDDAQWVLVNVDEPKCCSGKPGVWAPDTETCTAPAPVHAEARGHFRHPRASETSDRSGIDRRAQPVSLLSVASFA